MTDKLDKQKLLDVQRILTSISIFGALLFVIGSGLLFYSIIYFNPIQIASGFVMVIVGFLILILRS